MLEPEKGKKKVSFLLSRPAAEKFPRVKWGAFLFSPAKSAQPLIVATRLTAQRAYLIGFCLKMDSGSAAKKARTMAQPTSSWLPVAESSDFGINNIPFGVVSTPGKDDDRIATIIGDNVRAPL